MSSKKWGYLCLAVGAFSVGSNVSISKYMVAELPLFVFLGIRYTFSFLFFLALYLIKRPPTIVGEGPSYILKKEKKYLFLGALCAGLLFNSLVAEGLKFTTATAGGIITSTLPAMTALLAVLFLREKLGWLRAFSIALAVFGIVIINFDGGGVQITWLALLGDALVFLSMVPEAAYTVIAKLLGDRIHPIVVGLYICGINVLLFLPFSLYEGYMAHVTSISTFDLGILAVGGWLTAQYFLFWKIGLNYVHASTAGLFSGLTPVGAVFAAIVFLGEHFTFYDGIGMLCVLLSIVIGNHESSKRVTSD